MDGTNNAGSFALPPPILSPSTTPRPIQSGTCLVPSIREREPSPGKVWVDLPQVESQSPFARRRHISSPAYLGPIGANVDSPSSSRPSLPSPLAPAAAGIGLQFAMQPSQGRLRLVITGVIAGGAASHSAIEVGDEVLEVNGRDCANWTVGEVWSQVSGPPGSIVGLKVMKEGTGQLVSTQLIRRGPPAELSPLPMAQDAKQQNLSMPALSPLTQHDTVQEAAKDMINTVTGSVEFRATSSLPPSVPQATAPREANFSQLEQVLSGHTATANSPTMPQAASPVSIRKVPVLPLAAMKATAYDDCMRSEGTGTHSHRAHKDGEKDSRPSLSTRSCSIVSPRFQSEQISHLEATIIDLQHKNVELEAVLHRSERQHRQDIFQGESMLMISHQMCAEILIVMRNLSKAADVGKALGLLPLEQGRAHLEELMSLRKLAPASQAAPRVGVLGLQEREGYEREIQELRQMSEAMLSELQRRMQGVEQAEEEAALWRERAEALQGRLSQSDEEYSKLEERLTDGVSRIRQHNEQELAGLTEENMILRNKMVEVCDEVLGYRRQNSLLLECLKDVAASFRAIGGEEADKLRDELKDVEPAPNLVQRVLLDANVQEAQAIAACLDDLMAQACVLQRHISNLSADFRSTKQKEEDSFQSLRSINSTLVSLLPPRVFDPEAIQEGISGETILPSIDANLSTLRSQAQIMEYTMDEAEHRLASLEEFLGALCAVSKVKQLTHSGLLERMHVMSKQHRELIGLEHKALVADKEQRESVIQVCYATIDALRADLEGANAERSVLKAQMQSVQQRSSRVQELSEEHSRQVKELELALERSTSEKDALAADLWEQKAQHAVRVQQLASQVEQSFAGKDAEHDSMLRSMSSLELSVETFLDDMEIIIKKMQAGEASRLQDLRERDQRLALLQSEVRRLDLIRSAHLGSEVQSEQLEKATATLKSKVAELEESKAELEARLRGQRSKDMEESLTQQQLQVKISALQGLLDTREAEQAAANSRVRLVEARNGQLLAASQKVQKQLEEVEAQAILKEGGHIDQIQALTQHIVNLEKARSAAELETENARQSRAAIETAVANQRVTMDQLEETRQQRDELNSVVVAMQRQRDFVQAQLTVSERLLQEVVLLCQETDCFLRDSAGAAEHNFKQLSAAYANISDLQGNQQYMNLLYETRGNELQRLKAELEAFRSDEDEIIRLKEDLHQRAEAMAVMRIEMKELQEAMSDLVAEVESERAEHARVTESSALLSKQKKELEKRISELQNLAPHESEWTRLDELTETLQAKEQETFDLSRANMVMEARLADLQRKLGESMVHSSKIKETSQQLEQRDMALDALKQQLGIEKGKLESIYESLSERESACSSLADENKSLLAQITTLQQQLAEHQNIRESLQQKDADLKIAQERMMSQGEDMHQRLKVKDDELQVALADLAASRRLLENGLLEDLERHTSLANKPRRAGREVVEDQGKSERQIEIASPCVSARSQEESILGSSKPIKVEQVERGADEVGRSQGFEEERISDCLSTKENPPVTRSQPPSPEHEEGEDEESVKASRRQAPSNAESSLHPMEMTEIGGDASASTGNQDHASRPSPQTPEKSMLARWRNPTSHPRQQAVGIGVVLTEAEVDNDDDSAPIVVLDLIPGLPAHIDASLHIGCQILAVDGKSLRGLSLDEIRGKISGPPNTAVRIIYESIDGIQREVTLTRALPFDGVAVQYGGSSSSVSSAHSMRPSGDATQDSNLRHPPAHRHSPNVGPLCQVLTHRQSTSSQRSAVKDRRRDASPKGTFSGGVKNLILF